jgi:hypothetical protein
MQTVEEFMQNYLRDKTEMQQIQHEKIKEFHQKYFGESYIKFLSDWQDAKKNNPEIFVSIELYRLSAKAITTEQLGSNQQRYCYALVVSGQGWKIDSKISSTVKITSARRHQFRGRRDLVSKRAPSNRKASNVIRAPRLPP